MISDKAKSRLIISGMKRVMSAAESFEAPSWDQIYSFLIELADRIRASGFKPDAIVGVARGGWAPARVLSDLLDIQNLASVKVEFYVGVGLRAKKPVITQPVSIPLVKLKVLVVDDIADSGESLRLLRSTFVKQGASEVRAATIYRKPWGRFDVDYWAKETSSWVIFPWEVYESIKALGGRMLREGRSLDEVERRLVEIGLDLPTVRSFVKKIFGRGR